MNPAPPVTSASLAQRMAGRAQVGLKRTAESTKGASLSRCDEEAPLVVMEPLPPFTRSRYPLRMRKNVKASRNGRSRISSKHQVTIPAAAFHGAGLAAGDFVRVEVEGAGRVVLTKVDDLVDQYSGSLAAGGELRHTVDALRGDWS